MQKLGSDSLSTVYSKTENVLDQGGRALFSAALVSRISAWHVCSFQPPPPRLAKSLCLHADASGVSRPGGLLPSCPSFVTDQGKTEPLLHSGPDPAPGSAL